MASTAIEKPSRLDGLKWLAVLVVLAGGIYGNTQFGEVTLLYRVLAGLVVLAIAILISLQTQLGRSVWDLAKEARIEIRKVVWPSRQETTQTTLIVVVVVIFVALILWGMDSTLSWSISSIIG
jgi:preprotein translocase subunit SecE|tara:strand:+ start:201 stop:569 length:369 start_codon:yes stop_codon:yes gene_type:complete